MSYMTFSQLELKEAADAKAAEQMRSQFDLDFDELGKEDKGTFSL